MKQEAADSADGIPTVAPAPEPTPHEQEKTARKALFGSWLGWTFDGFETTSVILVAPIAVASLGIAAQSDNPSTYIAGLIAGTLLGWAFGGIIAGPLTDRLGRRRALMFSIAWYAVFSALSALAPSYWILFVLRFITGLGLGAEWGAGTALVSETSRKRSRGWAGGVLQSGFGVGSLAAALAWFLLKDTGPDAWRYLFALGALPALAVLYIRRNTPESPMWLEGQRQGARASRAVHPSLVELFRLGFSTPALKRRGLLLFLCTITTVIGFYAVSSWFYQYVGALATDAGRTGSTWASNSSLLFNGGAIVGYLALGFIADRIGRKPTMMLYFVGSLVVVLVMFNLVESPGAALVITAVGGFFILGQFSWMPIYMPELFPTAARATGMGLIFNSSRFVGAALTFTSGVMVTAFGGIGTAASIIGFVYIIGILALLGMPETKGDPLPD